VLLGERLRQGQARDLTAADEDLAEQTTRSPLLSQRELEVCSAEQALSDEE
jgi:hypothetical protein